MDNGYYSNMTNLPKKKGIKTPSKRLYQSVDEVIREFKEKNLQDNE